MLIETLEPPEIFTQGIPSLLRNVLDFFQPTLHHLALQYADPVFNTSEVISCSFSTLRL